MTGLTEIFTEAGLIWLFLLLAVLFIASFIIVVVCISKVAEKIIKAVEIFLDNL